MHLEKLKYMKGYKNAVDFDGRIFVVSFGSIFKCYQG